MPTQRDLLPSCDRTIYSLGKKRQSLHKYINASVPSIWQGSSVTLSCKHTVIWFNIVSSLKTHISFLPERKSAQIQTPLDAPNVNTMPHVEKVRTFILYVLAKAASCAENVAQRNRFNWCSCSVAARTRVECVGALEPWPLATLYTLGKKKLIWTKVFLPIIDESQTFMERRQVFTKGNLWTSSESSILFK